MRPPRLFRFFWFFDLIVIEKEENCTWNLNQQVRLDEQFAFAKEHGRYLEVDWIENLAEAWDVTTGLSE